MPWQGPCISACKVHVLLRGPTLTQAVLLEDQLRKWVSEARNCKDAPSSAGTAPGWRTSLCAEGTSVGTYRQALCRRRFPWCCVPSRRRPAAWPKGRHPSSGACCRRRRCSSGRTAMVRRGSYLRWSVWRRKPRRSAFRFEDDSTSPHPGPGCQAVVQPPCSTYRLVKLILPGCLASHPQAMSNPYPCSLAW